MGGRVDYSDNVVASGIVTGHASAPTFQTFNDQTMQRGFGPSITRNAAGDYTLALDPVQDFDGCLFDVTCRTAGGGTGPVNAQVLDNNGTTRGTFRVLMKDSAATPTAVDADFNITVVKQPGS